MIVWRSGCKVFLTFPHRLHQENTELGHYAREKESENPWVLAKVTNDGVHTGQKVLDKLLAPLGPHSRRVASLFKGESDVAANLRHNIGRNHLLPTGTRSPLLLPL